MNFEVVDREHEKAVELISLLSTVYLFFPRSSNDDDDDDDDDKITHLYTM